MIEDTLKIEETLQKNKTKTFQGMSDCPTTMRFFRGYECEKFRVVYISQILYVM